MEEIRWSTIEEFPSYKVSNHGDVVNQVTGRYLRPSQTRTGLVKVGFYQDGVQHSRSVALLVAKAFVFGRDEISNTPVHLDGDQENNHAENIVWRPRWFALAYIRQFTDTRNHGRGPVFDLVSREWYPTLLDAAKANGLLIKEIIRLLPDKKPIFPTQQIFSFRE